MSTLGPRILRRGCRVHAVGRPCCLIRSCGWGQVEPLEVGCPGPVQGLAGVPGVEADAVDGGGSGEVLQAGFVQAGVAGAADAGDVGGLGHGALDAGPGPVAVLEFGGVLAARAARTASWIWRGRRLSCRPARAAVV